MSIIETGFDNKMPNSPSLPQTTPDLPNEDIPQGLIELAGGVLQDMGHEIPTLDTPNQQESPDVVGSDEELEQFDEEFPLDDPDTDFESEEQLLDENSEVITYKDLEGKAIKMRVNGEERELSINQIAAMVGRAGATSKAQEEVNNHYQEIELMRSELDAKQEWLNNRHHAAENATELSKLSSEIGRYEIGLSRARDAQDGNAIAALKDKLELLQSEHDELSYSTSIANEEAYNYQVQQEVAKLNSMGYGEILTNPQHQAAFKNYATSNLTDQAIEQVNMDASLMAIVDKARKYDKARAQNGKVKTNSKKSLNSGTGKSPKANNKPQTEDEYFQSMAKQMLKGVV